jgi:hypothetical protein
VVVIAQEDKDLKSHSKMLNAFGSDGPYFDVLADLERAETLQYDRVTSYLINKQGKVEEIFPMIIHGRSGWDPILSEIDKLHASQMQKGE